MTITTNHTRNGVDTEALFATLDAIKADYEIADFHFRAENTWVSGTHTRSTISGFYGAMQEMAHTKETGAGVRSPPCTARSPTAR